MASILKVDGVASASEAEALQSLCVDYVCVSFDCGTRSRGESRIRLDEIKEIKDILVKAKLVLDVDLNALSLDQLDSIVRDVGPNLIQVESNGLPDLVVRERLCEMGVGIVCAGIEAAHDDDPAWILSEYEGDDMLSVEFLQIDICPELSNSWESIRNISPQYPEELQIEDLNALADKFPLIFVADYSEDNICDAINQLASARGVCFDLIRVCDERRGRVDAFLSVVKAIEKVTGSR